VVTNDVDDYLQKNPVAGVTPAAPAPVATHNH
jgi:hypothetical protein